MEIYIDEAHAQSIIDMTNAYQIDAQIIGRVEASEKKITYNSDKSRVI